jgi:hypothetical protein
MGWHAESLDWLDADEISAVKKCTKTINEFVFEIMTQAVRAAIPSETLLAV